MPEERPRFLKRPSRFPEPVDPNPPQRSPTEAEQPATALERELLEDMRQQGRPMSLEQLRDLID